MPWINYSYTVIFLKSKKQSIGQRMTHLRKIKPHLLLKYILPTKIFFPEYLSLKESELKQHFQLEICSQCDQICKMFITVANFQYHESNLRSFCQISKRTYILLLGQIFILVKRKVLRFFGEFSRNVLVTLGPRLLMAAAAEVKQCPVNSLAEINILRHCRHSTATFISTPALKKTFELKIRT